MQKKWEILVICEESWADENVYWRKIMEDRKMSRIKKMKDGARGERKKLRGAIQTRDKKRGWWFLDTRGGGIYGVYVFFVLVFSLFRYAFFWVGWGEGYFFSAPSLIWRYKISPIDLQRRDHSACVIDVVRKDMMWGKRSVLKMLPYLKSDNAGDLVFFLTFPILSPSFTSLISMVRHN